MNTQNITLLDLGGVVFQSTGTSNDLIDWTIISRLNEQYGHALNIGEDTFPDFLADYNRLTNQNLGGQAFLKAVFDTLIINQELIDIVRAHSDIIIVSDNYRENIAYISKRYRFEDWAIRQIYSFDYNVVKSDPDFFKKLLEDLSDYPIDNMLFIDDSIKKIESAQKSGIKSILYKNNQQISDIVIQNSDQ
ncbi:MAG: HAD-IA family hydrolase [Bacteroidota bacterium]